MQISIPQNHFISLSVLNVIFEMSVSYAWNILFLSSRECSTNPEEKIINRVKEMGETFCTCYAMVSLIA